MANKFGPDLIAELKAQRERLCAERDARFSMDMDDCFYSSALNNSQFSEIDLKLEILENGGMAEFDCLRSKTTNEIVSRKIVEGKFGFCHLIDEAFRDEFGTFVSIAQREATYTKKNLVKGTYQAAAWVGYNFPKGAKGLAAACSARPSKYESKFNFFTGEASNG